MKENDIGILGLLKNVMRFSQNGQNSREANIRYTVILSKIDTIKIFVRFIRNRSRKGTPKRKE